mgnify:CR=1 FL=1
MLIVFWVLLVILIRVHFPALFLCRLSPAPLSVRKLFLCKPAILKIVHLYREFYVRSANSRGALTPHTVHRTLFGVDVSLHIAKVWTEPVLRKDGANQERLV